MDRNDYEKGKLRNATVCNFMISFALSFSHLANISYFVALCEILASLRFSNASYPSLQPRSINASAQVRISLPSNFLLAATLANLRID